MWSLNYSPQTFFQNDGQIPLLTVNGKKPLITVINGNLYGRGPSRWDYGNEPFTTVMNGHGGMTVHDGMVNYEQRLITVEYRPRR